MLSDEEKKKYEEIKYNNGYLYCDKEDVDCLIDIIEKQSKEIEELKAKKDKYYYEWKHLEANMINKIEELDNPLSETFKSLLNAEEPTWSGTIKQFLQSLLEKE